MKIMFWIWLFDGALYQGDEKAEARSWCTDEQPLLVSHRLYDVEKVTVTGGSNLKLSPSGAQQKVLC